MIETKPLLDRAREHVNRPTVSQESKITWSPVDSEKTNWRAYFRGLEIGGYSTKPHPREVDGVYAWFGTGKFWPVPQDETEARALIEQTLKVWAQEAAEVHLS